METYFCSNQGFKKHFMMEMTVHHTLVHDMLLISFPYTSVLIFRLQILRK